MSVSNEIGRQGEHLLEARGLCKSFGGIHAVRDVSLHVDSGDIVGLIGPNGAGKTTCFNLMTGFYRPTSGKVFVRGKDVTNASPHRMANEGVVRTFQKTNILGPLSILENVLAGHYLSTRQGLLTTFFPGRAVKAAEREALDDSRRIVELIGLGDRAQSPAHQLSCGDLRLLEVGIALSAKPTVLLLDEPAAGLNNREADDLGRMLMRLRDEEVASILIVEHNMSLVMEISDRVVVMNFGEKLAEGLPAHVRQNPEVVAAYLGKGREK
ncbi:Branched-chain amino acid transport system ATP-binding protein OS=Castellaniella defragrans OX=75697 GN=HNR28_000340 PE=4 SV=1 [Castellaniella defragrans]